MAAAARTTVWGSKGYTLRSRPCGYISSVLQNGSGRYVQQLQRITLRFCEKSPKSKQTRDFLENRAVNFANNNPGVVLYVTPESNAEPKLHAEFLNGRSETISLLNLTEEEIVDKCYQLRDLSGQEIMKRLKTMHTDFPSIQGEWTPFTNLKNYSIKSSPNCTIMPRNAWDYLAQPWKSYYRGHEIEKLQNRPKLTVAEKSELPLGKWGPKLRPTY